MFQRGRAKKHQPVLLSHYYPIIILLLSILNHIKASYHRFFPHDIPTAMLLETRGYHDFAM